MRFVGILLLLAFAEPAFACPAPGPCLKYRRMPPPATGPVQVYASTNRFMPQSFDRARVQRYLDGSLWTETSPRNGLRSIEFASAATVNRTRASNRLVLIREIERRRGLTYVSVDGAYYALTRCPNSQAACLVAATLPEPDSRFATPP